MTTENAPGPAKSGNKAKPERSFLWKTRNRFRFNEPFPKNRNDRSGLDDPDATRLR
jgi:hypothetical protein